MQDIQFGDKVFKQGVHRYQLLYRKGFRHPWEYRYFVNLGDAKREKTKKRNKFMHAVVQFLDAKGCWIDI